MKKSVHRDVAAFLAWSMKAATCGVFPETGFLGEEFDKKSHRYRLRGQKICNGWRPIMFCENENTAVRLFVFNVLGT